LKTRSIILTTAVFSIAAIGGCQDAKQGSTSKAGDRILIAFVTNNPSNYWADARRGTDDAAKQLPNVDVQFVMPDDGTAATQKTDVDQLLAKGVKGIAISPVDPQNQTQMLNDIASQAKLVTQDSDAPLSNRICYIGTDNHAAGLQAADLIKKALPSGGKIMLFVGKRDAQNAKEREKGIRDGLAGSKVDILDVRTDDTDRAKAKSNALDALVKYPNIAGLVGLWSYNGPAIMSAVKDSNKVGSVKIVCFDTDPGTLDGVKAGVIYGTIVQQPYQFGVQAVKDLVKSVQGDSSWIPQSKQLLIPTVAVTKANVDQFTAPAK